jgi:hypothetical protein
LVTGGFERGALELLAADRVKRGIGNLGSRAVQAELDPWLEGIELLILDNLSSLTPIPYRSRGPDMGHETPRAQRRFLPPWSIVVNPESFCVADATGHPYLPDPAPMTSVGISPTNRSKTWQNFQRKLG